RARCPRHPPGRSSRLALVHAPPRAGQYHHHSAAAEVPRAQPGRERLAVHARQLALQPHLQILRRSRRPLLCGMEQARRSALAHHVHRTAPMGPRVLINGIWYYSGRSGQLCPKAQQVVSNGAQNTDRVARFRSQKYQPFGFVRRGSNKEYTDSMIALSPVIGICIATLFKPRRQLAVENLFLRHQLNIYLRRAPHRLRLRASDRAALVGMICLWPSLFGLSRVVQPDTILRWHRAGFRAYWRWKSRGRPGRPRVSRELRELIAQMSKENPLWGAPRIHGELLKLGLEIAESTVSKYMIRRRGPPSQTWRTFLRNHADVIAAIDLCMVPTLTFECLFAFQVVGHGRRQLLWFAVTRHPTAEWLAQQSVEAFPWDTPPAYLVRDNDRVYGQAFTSRIRTMGIRVRPISPRSPWQNPYVERLIGTLRRDCLDHILI